jgi:dihydropyrimidinase
MNVDYSAYEGMEITGKVAVSISRGEVVVAGDEFRGSAGHGAFLTRGLNQYLV